MSHLRLNFHEAQLRMEKRKSKQPLNEVTHLGNTPQYHSLILKLCHVSGLKKKKKKKCEQNFQQFCSSRGTHTTPHVAPHNSWLGRGGLLPDDPLWGRIMVFTSTRTEKMRVILISFFEDSSRLTQSSLKIALSGACSSLEEHRQEAQIQ